MDRDVVEDATVITARRMDKEVKYSGYYKTYGWKKDLFIESNRIFLSYKDLEINDDEGMLYGISFEEVESIIHLYKSYNC